MNRNTNANPQKKSGPATSQKVLPLFREADLPDGRGEDEANRRAEEGQRRLQVFSAIGEFMKGRRKRHGR